MLNLKKNLDGTFFSLALVFPSKSARCNMYSLSYSDQSSVSHSRKPSSSFVLSNKCMGKKCSFKALCLCGDENCLSYTSFRWSDVFSTSKYNRSSSNVSLVVSLFQFVKRTSAAS